MTFSRLITIALCFNEEIDAKRLSERLRDIDPFISFIISANFNNLLETVGKGVEIDCFIIEEDYKEYPADELIRNLQKSRRYNDTAFTLFSQDLSATDKRFQYLNLSYQFDLNTDFRNIINNIKKIIAKNMTPIIPKNFNVLVLDNNNEFLEVMTMHLNELGHHKIQLCVSVADAKRHVTHSEYDLLLLDWNLDDGTCMDLIEFINKSPVSPRTKGAIKMVITGRNSVDDIVTLLNNGIKNFIIKPFDFHELENKLDYALEKGITGRKAWP